MQIIGSKMAAATPSSTSRSRAAGQGRTPAIRGRWGGGSYRNGALAKRKQSIQTLAGMKAEGWGQSKGLGPRCQRKTSAGSQVKTDLLHEASCNGPLVKN